MTFPCLSNPSEPFTTIFIRAPAVHSLRPRQSVLIDQTSLESRTTVPSALNGEFAVKSTTNGHPPIEDGQNNVPVEILCELPPDLRPSPPPPDTHLGPANPDDLGKVMLRQGRKMVTSFHPELSGDVRVHEYWVERCVLGTIDR